MASTLDSPPVAKTIDVETLVHQAWRGDVRVPHFQRDFRWAWEDVRRLFDSILKGYPIGSLLLWQRAADAAVVQLGAIRIDATRADRAYWVVDGQQRLTSLANALHPDGAKDPRFALSYDLRRKELVKPAATSNPFIIPLPVLFDLQKLLRWFASNPGLSDSLDHATSLTKRLRQYDVPAYLVESDDASILQDIFDRMNNYGRRLSRAEIFTALNAGPEQLTDDSRTLDGIAQMVDDRRAFGLIDSDTVLACVLARRGAEIRRDIRSEFDKAGDEGLNAAYEAGGEALLRAVTFLQNVAGVPHFSFLAYRYLLVVLTRVFALFPEIDARNERLLRRWYWQTAAAGPEQFKGGTPNAARILCSRVVASDGLTVSVQRLLAAVASATEKMPDAKRFNSNDANSKMLLCVLWSLNPLDPLTAEPYSTADLASALVDARTAQPALKHLVPQVLVPENLRPWASNRALMPNLAVDSSELIGLLSQPPLDLEPDTWESVLSSHLVPTAFDASDRSNVGAFLDARQELLEETLRAFFKSRCEWRLENTPPLASLDFDEDA